MLANFRPRFLLRVICWPRSCALRPDFQILVLWAAVLLLPLLLLLLFLFAWAMGMAAVHRTSLALSRQDISVLNSLRLEFFKEAEAPAKDPKDKDGKEKGVVKSAKDAEMHPYISKTGKDMYQVEIGDIQAAIKTAAEDATPEGGPVVPPAVLLLQSLAKHVPAATLYSLWLRVRMAGTLGADQKDQRLWWIRSRLLALSILGLVPATLQTPGVSTIACACVPLQKHMSWASCRIPWEALCTPRCRCRRSQGAKLQAQVAAWSRRDLLPPPPPIRPDFVPRFWIFRTLSDEAVCTV